MLFSKTAKEIRAGLWAISPYNAFASLQLAHKILAGETGSEKTYKIDAAVRYFLDENGAPYQAQNVDETPPNSIGVVEIIGDMIKYGNYYCYGADELVAFAQMFDDNPNIIGQIWKMDTGGGSISSVAPFRDFLKNKKKPVVARCDMCASAGLFVASGTDHIQAENDISSMFGSVGVMATLRSYEKYFEAMGVKEHVIMADQSGHKNKEFTEALKGNYELMKTHLLNPAAITFQNYMRADRGKKLNEDVEGLLEGGIFYAGKAIEYGLADSMGTMQDAIEKVKELAAVSDFMNNKSIY